MSSLEKDFSRILSIAVFGMLIGLSTFGCDRKTREIPELSKRSEYEKIFADIDRAEAESDPIKRCLAYPTPPHLDWPPALIDALCRDKFTGGSFAAELKPMIDGRQWKTLDAHFAGFLERHHSGEDPEYRLYRAFPVISWDSQADAERYTLRWLKGALNSPYANTARAKILMGRAWEMRGNGFAREVIPEHMRKAVSIARQASVLLNRAIKQEPRLMPAYEMMMDAYALGGQQQMVKPALRAALRQSPSSYYLRNTASAYLSPLWGGSLEALEEMVEESRPYITKNPRLMMLASYRETETARGFFNQNHYERVLPLARKALNVGPSHEALVYAQYSASKLGYEVESLVYLTQIIRFERAPGNELLRRAVLWESDGDFTRALRDLHAAAKLYPTDVNIARKLTEAQKRVKAAQATQT